MSRILIACPPHLVHLTKNSDSPKDANFGEESDGDEKPEGQKGKFQNEDEPQPTNMADARAAARVRNIY
jgi:hypothetical protein